MKLSQKQIAARENLKTIRKYVDFDYDLRKKLHPSQIRKINKYHDEFEKLTVPSRFARAYRPSKTHLKAAQKWAGHDPALKDFKVAFAPGMALKNAKIKWKNGLPVVSQKHSDQYTASFDPIEMIRDPKSEINLKIKDIEGLDGYTIRAGPFEIARQTFRDVDLLKKELFDKVDNPKYAEGTGHYYADWMIGVFGYKIKNQVSREEFNRMRGETYYRGQESNKKKARNTIKRKIAYIKERIRVAKDAADDHDPPAWDLRMECRSAVKSAESLNNKLPPQHRLKIKWPKKVLKLL